MKTTDNMLQETGASALSESIKKNTTLQKLYLNCLSLFERNKKHGARDKKVVLYSSVNGIGESGATSLSDALKVNTTLTALHLGSRHKREDIFVICFQQPFFVYIHGLTGCMIESIGGSSLGEALKINTTLTKLSLFCEHHE